MHNEASYSPVYAACEYYVIKLMYERVCENQFVIVMERTDEATGYRSDVDINRTDSHQIDTRNMTSTRSRQRVSLIIDNTQFMFYLITHYDVGLLQ